MYDKMVQELQENESKTRRTIVQSKTRHTAFVTKVASKQFRVDYYQMKYTPCV